MNIDGLDEWEAEEAARRAAEDDRLAQRIAAKSEAERQRHLAMGWITEDGEPGPNAPQDDEDEEDEDC